MIQLRSILNAADNTGVKTLKVFHIHSGHKRRFGKIGDLITASVFQATPTAVVKKGKVVKAVVVRTKKELRRSDGSYIRFSDNAAVILTDLEKKEPRGTRIFGPIPREIKELGHQKIASLAQEVL